MPETGTAGDAVVENVESSSPTTQGREPEQHARVTARAVASWRVQTAVLLLSILASSLIATGSLLFGAHAQRLQTTRQARETCQMALLNVTQDLNDEANALSDHPGVYPAAPLRQLTFDRNRVKVVCYTKDVLDVNDARVTTYEATLTLSNGAWLFTGAQVCPDGTKSNMGACACLRMEETVVDLDDTVRNLPNPTLGSTVSDVWHSVIA